MPTSIIPIRQINLPVNVQNVPLEIWLNGTKATVQITTRSVTPIPVISREINLSVGPAPVQFKIQPVSVLLPITGAETGLPGPPGATGPPGTAATIAVGTTTTSAPGGNASVINTGTANAAVFNFTIPTGSAGPTGPASTVPGPPGPTGPASTVPGPAGQAATIAAGTATGLPAGSQPTVNNSGSSSAAVFNFGIPAGATGATGATGNTGSQGPAGQGVPSGGSANQVLSKIDATDYHTQWTTLAGGGDMLKSVYDTNANSIVDAAESVPWTGVTGKPSSFTPAVHASTHLSAGSDPISIASATLAGLCPMVDNTTIQVVASKLSAVALAWTAITGKPSTFPPDATAMLKSVYDTNSDNIVDHAALADAAPWTGLTGVPSSFTPSTHAATHVTGGSDVIALATSSARGLLTQVSGNTTDFVDGTNNCQNLDSGVARVISQRTRGYNAIGNPNFEVDQRNVGATVNIPTGGNTTFSMDRWTIAKSTATATFSVAQGSGTLAIPGTNFPITSKNLTFTLKTQQASLAAGEYIVIRQNIEGSALRELVNDVHSISLYVWCGSAPVTFTVRLGGSPTAYSLTKVFTISTAATWTLITLPNIPIWPSAGGWLITPGSLGYVLDICLGAGSTYLSPANDTWQVGAYFVGAGSTTNFASLPLNTQFAVAFVQHEPGPLCTSLIDKPFSGANGNLEECQRYYQKTYPYSTAIGSVTTPGIRSGIAQAAAVQSAYGPFSFSKIMAKVPTITLYNHATGAANSVRDGAPTPVDHGSASVPSPGDSGFYGIAFSTGVASICPVFFHYTADTGW